MNDRSGAQRLAEAVKRRRTHLGLSQGALAFHGGPSVVTVGEIERAKAGNIQPLTLAGLDTALGWKPGTASAILHDNAPPAAPDVRDDRDLEEAIASAEAMLRHLQALREARRG